ncbi:hypothetical protein H7992_21670 [Sporosarcina sp. resist]|uniref:hypothetical protein n=1 Tax=Sporosarcina sp. resist TaxID=2762563 RepID=UPI00164D7F9C|nr:hypothetical protein [Sporosarcina sp. resist]QNK87745.1 hypothetical protein H7992_21670 [Sporosarcina sp. resist]
MAKLTARFDIQDKISKKLRIIRGEIYSLQRARDQVNKPMTMIMRARDNATKILKRLHLFVLKDIAKMHTVVVKVKDGATKTLTSISNFMKRRMPRTHALFVRATDRAMPVLQRVSRFVERNIGRTQIMTILATDRAMPVISRIGTFARSTLSKGWNFTVRATDMASGIIRRIGSFAAIAIPQVRTFTIRAINGAMSVISSVKNALFSIPTLITVTLAAVGLGKLKDSTLGAAMRFEDYGVAMNHWMKGDKKATSDLMDWMGKKADKTPFSTPDIFPAMTGAVALAGNDPKSIKRLTSTAIDMAALSGGRSSVEDAMQALTMAKMGNFTMMKGFGMQITKKDYDKMGWAGFQTHVESVFEGGAEALSKTASGIFATLKGYRGSLLRTIGDGFLGPMKPRLDSINKWLENNQETWGRWKSVVNKHGEEASEFIFSRLENSFNHLRSRYLDNKDFMSLNFQGKIAFVMDDIGSWWSSKGKPALEGWWKTSGKPWAATIGLTIGEAIFNGVVLGIPKGLGTLGEIWTDVGIDIKKNGINKETATSVAGAGAATLGIGALALGAASFVLTPVIKGIQAIGKAGGWVASKVTGKGAPGTRAEKPPKVAKVARVSKPPNYTMPWTNQGERPALNVPNDKGSKFPKLPKGLSSIGNFSKRIPVLGTAIGALAIATSSNADKAGAVGAVGGGLAGAATGAALGSVVPVVGTAIGGIIGGIVGSIGGQEVGDWLSENWTSIKSGASATGKWISQKFNDSVEWISNTWSSFTDWFSSSVWQPISDGAGAAVKWVSDKWSALTGWFSEKVLDPLMKGFDKSISFIVGLYDIGETFVKAGWSLLSGWFKEKVWTPLKTAAGVAWDWISTRVSSIWTGIQVLWGMASAWFTDTVWTPLSTAASIAWEWISTLISDAWFAVQTLWGIAVTWFQETIWTPLMTAVGVVGTWIGEKFTEGWTAVTALWGVATRWFEETVWTPLNTAVRLLGTWIGDKFTEGWNVVSDIWGVASSYFEENIWTPIKTGAGLVKDAIIKPFEEAWEFVSGIFTKLGDTWDTIKQWGGKAVEWGNDAVGYVIDRGEQRRGIAPEYARGTNYHPGGPAIVGDGGGPELIRYPNGGMSLSPGTDTMMNLPRGTEVLSHRKTVKFFNQAPTYADGVGFGGGVPEKVILQEGQVAAASSKSGSKQQSIGSKVRDIIIEITGDNHYSDEMDAEKVGKIAYDYIKKALQNERFEGGEMVVDG